MSEDDHIQFRFERGDLDVEISGPRRFVESLSREVMRDVGDVIARRHELSQTAETGDESAVGSEPAVDESETDQVVWLVRSGDLMQRIFMAEPRDLSDSELSDVLNLKALHTLSAASPDFDRAFPEMTSKSSTVWGKLTDAGRQQIRDSG